MSRYFLCLNFVINLIFSTTHTANQIIKATYGTDSEHTLDITDLLKEKMAVGEQRNFAFKLNTKNSPMNDLFGDPAFHHKKVLTVEWIPYGSARLSAPPTKKVFNEEDNIELNGPLKIVKATYGPPNNPGASDVTEKLKNLIYLNFEDILPWMNKFVRDPDPGSVKRLIVEYIDAKGTQQKKVLTESSKSEIISATYGAGNESLDVTQKLKVLMNTAIGEFGFGFAGGPGSFNRIFGGDPLPGQRKMLDIKYIDMQGKQQWHHIPEDRSFELKNFSKIEQAFYGNMKKDVTPELRKLIYLEFDALPRCFNKFFGDPAPGKAKTLTIEYSDANMEIKTKAIPENPSACK